MIDWMIDSTSHAAYQPRRAYPRRLNCVGCGHWNQWTSWVSGEDFQRKREINNSEILQTAVHLSSQVHANHDRYCVVTAATSICVSLTQPSSRVQLNMSFLRTSSPLVVWSSHSMTKVGCWCVVLLFPDSTCFQNDKICIFLCDFYLSSS